MIIRSEPQTTPATSCSPAEKIASCFKRGGKKTLLGLGLLSVAATPAASARDARNFADLTIEELMNESVTSVSKRAQKLGDAAAAITVLTHDDLARSGAASIAESLRLVPGMDVAVGSASDWAISARGFNGVFSNKLLMLVDGRAVYSPLFSGVFWDLQQSMLQDLDRIEVIRGPGATIWGANAVNGVINVVSRSASETQGGYVYGGGGDVHRAATGMRYGGKLAAKTYYRVFGSYQTHDNYPLASGGTAADAWQARHGGFRIDSYPADATHLTWQADATATKLDDGISDSSNVNTLARWTHQLSDRSGLEVQAYYDRTARFRPYQFRIESETFDLTAQHSFGLGAQHDFTWGLGSRFNVNRVAPTNPANAVRIRRMSLPLSSAFVQDEFKVVPETLTFTPGFKLEHNSYTGWEFQPGLRAVFKPTERQTLWAAASRAVRTPNAFEGTDMTAIAVGAPFPGPGGGLFLPAVIGNTQLRSEVLHAYEVGYRVQPASRVSFDLAAFHNTYHGIVAFGGISNFVPGLPFGTAEIPAMNLLNGHLTGGEAIVTVTPREGWRITASYSTLHASVDVPPVPNPAASERSAPRNQAALRLSYDFSPQAGGEAELRYVDTIQSVPAYLTADLHVLFHLSERLTLSIVGQNLLDKQHPEQSPQVSVLTSEAPRNVHAKLQWQF